MSAKRYAKALFDVAIAEQADLAEIDRDIAGVAEMVTEHGELLHSATRSQVPEASRQNLVAALSSKLGIGPHVSKVFAMLAHNHALELVPAVAAAYRERLLAHQNLIRAEITSATPLSPENTTRLADNLSKVTGKKVEVSVSVDPELLGGVIARIGSTVYDGSVRTQLTKMRQQLVEK